MLKKICAAAIGLSMLLPIISSAQTTAPSIAQLLEQIKTLQAKIIELQKEQQATLATLFSTLKQGSQGDQVKTLQALLASDPSIYPEGLITGYYGPKTYMAVMKFQMKHGLPAAGNVGPQTLAKLQKLLGETPLAITGTSTGNMPCAIVPPGHMIAPGWLKKNSGNAPVVPPCQKLPPGIAKKLGLPIPPPTGTTTPPTSDTTAPILSLISNYQVGSISASVSWTTNEPATTKIYFGTITPLVLNSASTTYSGTLVTNHSATLSGLIASTTYYYVVESADAASNTATSTERNLNTTN